MKRRAFRSRTAGIRKTAVVDTDITRTDALVHGGRWRRVSLLGRRSHQTIGAQRADVVIRIRLAGARGSTYSRRLSGWKSY
jgi:hypothetical protein